jgi:hypothetical protein
MVGMRCLFLPLLVCLVLVSASAALRAAAVDAQEACVAPVQAFVAALDEDAADQARRAQFLDLVRACREVYRDELQQVEGHYPRLSKDSNCRAMGEEFRDTLTMLTRIEQAASELSLDTPHDREVAAAFYRLAAPGLSRAVSGLFILHYGICQEEARVPVTPSPSSNATISEPGSARGQL